MLLFFRIMFLASLVQLSVRFDPLRERPVLIALLYSLGCFLLNMAQGAALIWAGIGFAVILVLATIFFWLLSRIEDSLGNWLITLVVGTPLLLFGDQIAYQILRTRLSF